MTTRVSDFDSMISLESSKRTQTETLRRLDDDRRAHFVDAVVKAVYSRTDDQLGKMGVEMIERFFPRVMVEAHCRPLPAFGARIRETLDDGMIRQLASNIRAAQPLYPVASVVDTIIPFFGVFCLYLKLSTTEPADPTLALFPL